MPRVPSFPIGGGRVSRGLALEEGNGLGVGDGEACRVPVETAGLGLDDARYRIGGHACRLLEGATVFGGELELAERLYQQLAEREVVGGERRPVRLLSHTRKTLSSYRVV